MHQKIISASILSANFAHLGDEAKNALKAGVDQIHFDVMDHHFVPNLSFGTVVCEALRKDGITAPIDVHLMVDNPDAYIEPFAKAGANLITFHPETSSDVEKTLKKISDQGMQAGLAFNPSIPVNISDKTLSELDMILLMSVNPGFGGQSFIENCYEKIRATKDRMKKIGSRALLGVDGGIKASNISKIADMGADFFVVGSGLFHSENYKKYVDELRAEI